MEAPWARQSWQPHWSDPDTPSLSSLWPPHQTWHCPCGFSSWHHLLCHWELFSNPVILYTFPNTSNSKLLYLCWSSSISPLDWISLKCKSSTWNTLLFIFINKFKLLYKFSSVNSVFMFTSDIFSMFLPLSGLGEGPEAQVWPWLHVWQAPWPHQPALIPSSSHCRYSQAKSKTKLKLFEIFMVLACTFNKTSSTLSITLQECRNWDSSDLLTWSRTILFSFYCTTS